VEPDHGEADIMIAIFGPPASASQAISDHEKLFARRRGPLQRLGRLGK
jgi:hypothetical protein